MNVPATLQPVVEDLTKRIGAMLKGVEAPRPNEVYFDVLVEAVPGLCARIYRRWKGRLVSVFADDTRIESGCFHLYYVLALDDLGAFCVLRVPVPTDRPEFTSLSNALPSANWQEREIADLFGLEVRGHPNPRRCALHDDWPPVHPLRKDFDLRTVLPTFSGPRHAFRQVDGEGVFQVPVGPVHAGIIEPGHFLFSVAGEPVLYLQIRLFYTHKGTEKLFESIPVEHGVRLAESISGDSSFAHATAFCHAVERAGQAVLPPRGESLRSACLELERLYNHIGDIGAIANDVAFVVAQAHALRLRESLLRINERLTGNRLLKGMVCLGGVRFDWDAEQCAALRQLLVQLRPEFQSLAALIAQSSSTRDRLETTGVLSPAIAKDLGVVGIAGRASGFNHDLRRDFPHAAYSRLKFTVPVYTEGDVLRRLQVRVDEVFESIRILEQLLSELPAGPVRIPMTMPRPGAFALGYVEGWRGEIFHWVRIGKDGRLARCKVKDPSLQNWPALSEAILGNIVPDFPVINKSFNLSYSGTDR